VIGWCPLFFDDGLQFDNVARLGGSVPAHHTWAARIGIEGEISGASRISRTRSTATT
jgi:hypothetical protein